MYHSKYLIAFLIVFLPAKLIAQDITGLWKGTLYNDTTKKFYRYEVGISEEKGKLSGFSHTFFMVDDKEYYGVKKVKIKRTDGRIIIEDAGLIANNYPEAPAKGVRQLNVLTLEIKDSIMTLTGPFTTNRTKEYSALTGNISLQRKNDFWQSALVPHLQELGLSNDLSFVKNEAEQQKQEEEKHTAAQKDIAAIEKSKEIQKEKTVKENADKIKDSKTTKASKTEPTTASKEIASIDPILKPEGKKEKEAEVKQQPDISKEVASNNLVSKPEEKKENKPTDSKKVIAEPKEAVAVDGSKNQKENKEIKTAGTTSTTSSSKEVADNNGKLKIEKPTEPANNTKPLIAQAAAEVFNRTNVVQQTVYFSSDSLQLSLYDNGEVDGDTVSVLMNGKILMAREGLSTNAVRKTIFIEHNADSIELIMYAENLGAIAPNTGLLVVRDGKSIYEIRFSGDLKKNASIILRRKRT